MALQFSLQNMFDLVKCVLLSLFLLLLCVIRRSLTLLLRRYGVTIVLNRPSQFKCAFRLLPLDMALSSF